MGRKRKDILKEESTKAHNKFLIFGEYVGIIFKIVLLIAGIILLIGGFKWYIHTGLIALALLGIVMNLGVIRFLSEFRRKENPKRIIQKKLTKKEKEGIKFSKYYFLIMMEVLVFFLIYSFYLNESFSKSMYFLPILFGIFLLSLPSFKQFIRQRRE